MLPLCATDAVSSEYAALPEPTSRLAASTPAEASASRRVDSGRNATAAIVTGTTAAQHVHHLAPALDLPRPPTQVHVHTRTFHQ